ncbi:hypothetical protein EV589_1600 [Mycobacterium sp. BK558]|nr:hypothetical protein EV589_1600 [Mycobacterium sp. BK558]
MKPAHSDTLVPTVRPATHLSIVEIELPQQDGHRYDVTLRLCRPLTRHESHELVAHRSIGLEVSPDDPSRLIATRTTVEEVCDRLPEFHELLSEAADVGQAAQDAATRARNVHDVEEARRQHLVDDANASLRACQHTHDAAPRSTHTIAL